MSSASVPKTVWVLGIVSLLMDVSSEMIQTLLPLYLVIGLGASAMTLGFVEGFSVVVATVVKFFSGYVSDRFSRPKWLAVAGYGLSALSKPIFPLTSSLEGVFLAKGVDRVGKGIRPPRVMLWWLRLPPKRSAGGPMACESLWIRWGALSGLCWRLP